MMRSKNILRLMLFFTMSLFAGNGWGAGSTLDQMADNDLYYKFPKFIKPYSAITPEGAKDAILDVSVFDRIALGEETVQHFRLGVGYGTSDGGWGHYRTNLQTASTSENLMVHLSGKSAAKTSPVLEQVYYDAAKKRLMREYFINTTDLTHNEDNPLIYCIEREELSYEDHEKFRLSKNYFDIYGKSVNPSSYDKYKPEGYTFISSKPFPERFETLIKVRDKVEKLRVEKRLLEERIASDKDAREEREAQRAQAAVEAEEQVETQSEKLAAAFRERDTKIKEAIDKTNQITLDMEANLKRVDSDIKKQLAMLDTELKQDTDKHQAEQKKMVKAANEALELEIKKNAAKEKKSADEQFRLKKEELEREQAHMKKKLEAEANQKADVEALNQTYLLEKRNAEAIIQAQIDLEKANHKQVTDLAKTKADAEVDDVSKQSDAALLQEKTKTDLEKQRRDLATSTKEALLAERTESTKLKNTFASLISTNALQALAVAASLSAFLYFGSKHGVPLLMEYIRSTPETVMETSILPLSIKLKTMFGFLPPADAYNISDIVLPSHLNTQLNELMQIVKKAKQSKLGYPFALFQGPPGTGKTLAAKIIAKQKSEENGKTQDSMDYVIMSGAALTQLAAGKDIETFNNILKLADKSTKDGIILFIDEADSMLADREKEKDQKKIDLVNLFLGKFPETTHPKIFVIMATNFPENLDKAVLSRVAYTLDFELPDRAQRLSMMKLHFEKDLKDYPLENEAQKKLDQVAGSMEGFSGRQIKNLSVRLRTQVALRNRKNVSFEMLQNMVELLKKQNDK